jgi:hypothetical protein
MGFNLAFKGLTGIYIYLTNVFFRWFINSNGISSPGDYQVLEENSA